jgi:tetratricopeptide (TPR) repeat protein
LRIRPKSISFSGYFAEHRIMGPSTFLWYFFLAAAPPLPHDQIAAATHQRALAAELAGDNNRAEELYRSAAGEWALAGPSFADSHSVTLMNLAGLFSREHRFGEAEPLLAEALRTAAPVRQARAQLRLGIVYQQTGRSLLARNTLIPAIQALEAQSGTADDDLPSAWSSLGTAQTILREESAGMSSLRKAVTLARTVFGEEHIETAACEANLALALLERGQYSRALPVLEQARATFERQPSSSLIALAAVYIEISAAWSGERKTAHGEAYAQKALELISRQPKPDTLMLALAQVNLANVYLDEHRLDDAGRLLPSAIAVERETAPQARVLADGLRSLAQLRSAQHSWSQAQDAYRESIALYEKVLGPDHPSLAPVLREYAAVLRSNAGPKPEIRTLESRARELTAAFAPGS